MQDDSQNEPEPRRWPARRSVTSAAGVFLVVFAGGLWWARGIPANGAPDEPEHYALVEFVAEHGRLPLYGEPGFSVGLMHGQTHKRIGDARDRARIGSLRLHPQPVELRIPYLFVPQLPYVLNGWFNRVLGGPTLGKARAFSALCVALLALLVFLAARSLWPDRMLAAGVAGLCVGLWPQISFLAAYVNDDAFATLSAGALVAACAWCQRGSFDRKRAVALGAAVGLLCSSKPTVLGLLLLLGVWFIGFSLHRIDGQRRLRGPGFRSRTLLAVSVALALAGPWLIRNALLYDGDPTGHRFVRRELREFVGSLPAGVLGPKQTLFMKSPELRPDPRSFTGVWLQLSLSSFWARFGWMNVAAPRRAVVAALTVLAIGVVASFLLQCKRDINALWWSVPWVFALPAFLLLMLGSVANSYYADFQPQGRYLLGCVPGALLQIVGGLAGLGHRWVSRALLLGLVGFFVAENLFLRLRVLH